MCQLIKNMLIIVEKNVIKCYNVVEVDSMKKVVILFIIMFLTFINTVSASTGTVVCTGGDTSPLNVRDSVGGSYVGELSCNSTVEILDEEAGSNDSCSKWYEIKQGDLTGYSCGEYITINRTIENLKGKVSCVENDDPLGVRDGVNGNRVDYLSCDTEMDILDDTLGSAGSCSNWYKVSYGDNNEGYVCGTYVITYVDVDYDSEDIQLYRDSLISAGFPESYVDALVELHVQFPTWNFVPFNTYLDWDTVIDNESIQSRNLIYYSYGIGYRSHESYSYNWATDEYYRHPSEVNWWYASRDAVEYYMDPRNYLNSKNIFTFESLSYEPSFQTVSVVDKILGSSFMPGIYNRYSEESYTSAFMTAAEEYNVSPVHLASRILQEQGVNGSIASLGGDFTYNGNTYSGYFNFYNIRATGYNPAVQGLVWAMGGVDHLQTSYGRPWDSPYKSILGGARFLSEDYISIGQNTLYFQKFDVSRSDGHYTHQYMQNITAPLTEGVETYTSYNSISGLLDEALVFIIPVYDDMPEERVEAPSNLSPNSYLKSIKVDNEEIEGFSYDKFDYSMEVSSDVSSVDVSVSTVNSGASVLGNGTITLEEGENKIELVVTAENGNVSTYNVVINRQIKEEDIVLSNTNSLESITIEEIEFEFDKDTLEYNLEVPFETNKINISYELEDDTANIEADNEVELIVGLNKINIAVTAENGDVRTYTLNITRKEVAMSEVLNATGVKYNNENKYIYGIDVDTSTDSLIENIKSVSTSISVVIKDSEGKVKSGVFATGDKVIISDGVDTVTYEVLIYGDVTGDGVIDKLDYLAVLRHYYKYKEYNGVYKEAADADKNGVIDKLDFLAVLKDYYGYKAIEQ